MEPGAAVITGGSVGIIMALIEIIKYQIGKKSGTHQCVGIDHKVVSAIHELNQRHKQRDESVRHAIETIERLDEGACHAQIDQVPLGVGPCLAFQGAEARVRSIDWDPL